jgi:hypothetical protein
MLMGSQGGVGRREASCGPGVIKQRPLQRLARPCRAGLMEVLGVGCRAGKGEQLAPQPGKTGARAVLSQRNGWTSKGQAPPNTALGWRGGWEGAR